MATFSILACNQPLSGGTVVKGAKESDSDLVTKQHGKWSYKSGQITVPLYQIRQTQYGKLSHRMHLLRR